MRNPTALLFVVLCACKAQTKHVASPAPAPVPAPTAPVADANYTLDGNYKVAVAIDANQPAGCLPIADSSWSIQQGAAPESYYVDTDTTSNAFENFTATAVDGALTVSWIEESGDTTSLREVTTTYKVQLTPRGTISGDLETLTSANGNTMTCDYAVLGTRQL